MLCSSQSPAECNHNYKSINANVTRQDQKNINKDLHIPQTNKYLTDDKISHLLSNLNNKIWANMWKWPGHWQEACTFILHTKTDWSIWSFSLVFFILFWPNISLVTAVVFGGCDITVSITSYNAT